MFTCLHSAAMWDEQLCLQILNVQPALPAAALLCLWSPSPQPTRELLEGVGDLPRQTRQVQLLGLDTRLSG